MRGQHPPTEEPIFLPLSQPPFEMCHDAGPVHRDYVRALSVIRSADHAAGSESDNHTGDIVQWHVTTEGDVYDSLHASA